MPPAYAHRRSYRWTGSRSQSAGSRNSAEAQAAHAILWSGSAASAVDLNPAGFIYSYATGIGGGKQVGYGTKSNYKCHALVWSGSAQQYVDLHNFLPSTFAQSYANGVDAAGNIVRYATDTSGVNHAILWQCTCHRQYPGAAAGRNPHSYHPAVSAFPDSAVGSACT
jgi:hypothetical protein